MKVKRIELHQAAVFAKTPQQGFSIGSKDERLRDDSVEEICADIGNQIAYIRNKKYEVAIPFGNVKYFIPERETAEAEAGIEVKPKTKPKAKPTARELDAAIAKATVPSRNPLTSPPKP